MTEITALITQVDALDTARLKAEHECASTALILAATILRAWKLDVLKFVIEVDDQIGANGYVLTDALLADNREAELDTEVPDYIPLAQGYEPLGTIGEWVQDVAIAYLRETSLSLEHEPWATVSTSHEDYVTRAVIDIDGVLSQ